VTDIDFGAITAACEHLDNNGMAAAADAIRALDESRDTLLGHIGDLAERCDIQATTITGLQGERDLWYETAMKLKDRIANQPDQRERIHIIAAELRNLTARVEGYERAAKTEN
jgi:hypothetical protein